MCSDGTHDTCCASPVSSPAAQASCTGRVQDNILQALRLKGAKVIKASFNRPNIQYQVMYKDVIGDGGDDAMVEVRVALVLLSCGV